MLAADLIDEERRVILDAGTEPPFCGAFVASDADGILSTRACHFSLPNSATASANATPTRVPVRGMIAANGTSTSGARAT